MSKKGEIPVPYLIGIIFAVAIIAIIGYMFFTRSGIFSKELTKAECETRKLTYCGKWATLGCDSSKYPFDQEWDDYAPGCSRYGDELTIDSPDDCPTC